MYVPAGEFLYGNASDGDRISFDTTPMHRRSTAAFLISRTEVTFGEWLAYVDALPPRERAIRIPAVPSKMMGSLVIAPDPAGHWRIELTVYGGERYSAGWDKPLVYPFAQ